MRITRNSDSSYSAQGRFKGRLVVAEGTTRREAIQSYIYLLEDIADAS